jgi:hypothetical protein
MLRPKNPWRPGKGASRLFAALDRPQKTFGPATSIPPEQLLHLYAHKP